MTASNLGIIFGPTLIKPRQTDAEVSLSSLVDYPYQALIVELLIRHFQMIFDAPLSPLPLSSPLTSPVSAGEGSPLSRKSRLTAQEKERQLSRHSTSLVDIKEVSLMALSLSRTDGLRSLNSCVLYATRYIDFLLDE